MALVAHQQDSAGFIALYADEKVPYGKIVEVLSLGASNNLRMVLATKPVASPGVKKEIEKSGIEKLRN